MCKQIGMLSACAHRLYLYRPELFDSLRDEGYEVTVFGPEPQQQGDEWLGKEGITYIQLPLSRRGIDPIAEMKARALIVRTAKMKNIGLIYSYGIRFAPLANNAAKKAGIPCMNVVNGAGSLFISEGIKGKLKRILILPYIRYSLKHASRVVFQNDDDLAMFLSARLVKEAQTMKVHGSGVNTERFPVFPLPQERVFGYLSRLNPEKGIDELLRAFSGVLETYPDAKLRLAGELDGIEGSETQRLLDTLCAQGSAEYPGEISDVPAFLKTCRYFVFPSYREGTPRAVLEAMSCGRPVITTDTVGCRETVTDGFNGLLVEPKNVESLKKAMLRFCTETDDIEQMGMNARAFAEERFDVFAVNRALIGEVKSFY